MIGIIDYGSGNLMSVYNAFKYLGQDVRVCGKPSELDIADKIVLPGVGSSRAAMDCLSEKGLLDAIIGAIKKGKNFLGLCLGLQLLLETSEESGGCDCLGLFKGTVRLFPGNMGLKVPHMGWNTVGFGKRDCPIFKGIPDNSYFYFVHSYYCDNRDEAITAGVTGYGLDFTSAVWDANVFALQFHPERSQENGLRILRNFIEL
ncbi:MAG: imidazole glycerol phosphate synthase subunit HisH [Candidatus Omnitrophica bacterium]|nr:imidazole glycerol phosphate synthase subunit HisH [Candidatus Omnitrophota bacterium]